MTPGNCGSCPYWAQSEGNIYLCPFKKLYECTSEEHECDEKDLFGNYINKKKQ